jgi:hypothetical protein
MMDEIRVRAGDAVLILHQDQTYEVHVPVNHRDMAVNWAGLLALGLGKCLENSDWTDKVVRKIHRELVIKGAEPDV